MHRIPRRSPSDGRYDVAILGAGMAGAMLGAVLARHGVKVLLIDAGTHPRFAVGESTIPYTSAVTKIVAARYQVPEIEALSSFRNVHEKITPMCGRKRNFGFIYHREGNHQNPGQTNQLVISERQGSETHLFRQDTDAYLYRVAVSYGAEPRTGTRVTDIKIVPDRGVLLHADTGEEFHASYIVDAGGFRSPVAAALGLREEPTRARTHSRALFTHMVGVTPYDQAPSASLHTQPIPWHHGTLHHVFDGGWLWVIPFDNHEGSRNGLCSVGLTLDERAHPRPDCPPQQEFDAFLRRFPDIGEQFAAAKAIRPWVSTGRLQYSSTRTVGDRYCLTAHAAGFIDALYSRGLTSTLEVVNALAWRLIAASRDGDWSTDRFTYVDSMQQGLFDVHDDLVYSSFVSFRDYDLWNAVLRVWKAVSILPTVVVQRALRTFLQTGDDQVFRDLETTETPGLPAPVGHDVTALLTFTRQICQAVESGSLPPGEAAQRVFAWVGEAAFIPPTFEFADPARKYFEVTPAVLGQTREWAKSEAPGYLAPLFS
ncbi:MAG: tryptophan 7-halogenase [Actinobacteria bacterium]|nr:tryptophan 7-halogenase [Actinomycetota bacterium]